MGNTRAWRKLPRDLLAFATTDLYELRVAVMCTFEDAAVTRPAMSFDQVRAGLAAAGWDEPVDDLQLQQTLEKLRDWGLLDATQDHAARYATPEEFERRNLQWSLTPHGQAAIGGVLHAVTLLSRSVGLQPAVIDAIADGLTDLCELVAAKDAARVATKLAEVESHLESLVGNVRQFNTQLQRLLRDDATSTEIFEDVKQRTVNYLKEYIDGVERPARRVANGIVRVDELGAGAVLDLALRGANLAPIPDADPSVAWLAERGRRWDALRVWFAPADAETPRIRSLVVVARTAINQLLRVLERRWDLRRRSASAADDFRTLAAFFAGASDDEEAHRLFAAAFGMWSARHAHLRADDPDATPSTTSWLHAPPVLVAPSLRTSGDLTNRGRPSPVRDPAMVRARRQHEQAAMLEREEQVRDVLRTSGDVRLSAFSTLDPAVFRELLALLSEALSAPLASDGTRRAMSVDGRVEIVLRDPSDGRVAHIHSPDGTLTAPDLVVRVTTCDALEEQEEAALA